VRLAAAASRFLIGLVTCFATQGGIPAVGSNASRRVRIGEFDGKMDAIARQSEDFSATIERAE
jgi:hypothetical protein